MSSEDDYYRDYYAERASRYSSKKARRRGVSPKGRRYRDYSHMPRKSRRSRPFYVRFWPRLACVLVIIVLILYEVLMLRKGLSRRAAQSYGMRSKRIAHEQLKYGNNNKSPSSQSVPATSNGPRSKASLSSAEENPRSVTPLPPDTHTAEISSNGTENHERNSSDSAALNGATSAAGVGADSDSASGSSIGTASQANSEGSEKKPSHRVPESAIKMEAKAADDDPDADEENSTTGESQRGNQNPSHATSGTSSSDKTSAAANGDRGAEPGAGENFWKWFQETKGSDKQSVSKTIPCPEENRRLCEMFYKYVRKYKIRSIFDVSCEKNMNWIGEVLKKTGNELWGFKYYCSLWKAERAEKVRDKIGGLPFVEFDTGKWWRDGFAKDTELLFAWDTLAHLAYGRVWNFFVNAKKQNIKYILVDNYPGILNDPSPKREYLNLRKHPFRFPAAKEVAQNVTEMGETAKRQLLFYEISMLPDNLQ